MAPPTASASKQKSTSSLTTIYLLIYNSFLTIGWALILLETSKRVSSYSSLQELTECYGLWDAIEVPLKICQTAALLEVFHAMFGLVRSNPIIVFVQIMSRIFLVWGVANFIAHAQLTIGIFFAVTAWSITEIIRYGYYALNLFDAAPYFLTWCRYTFFIVLYPMGVTGELVTIVKAMRAIYPENIRNQYSILLPNKYNFALDYFYFLIFVVCAYSYFPTMYKHMFKQRAKTLQSDGTDRSKKVQ